MIWDVIIVGAGAAGLAAATEFKNKNVLLLEKMNQVGRKLNITGSGQCNVTHSGKVYTFKENYNNWNFVKHCLTAFTNEDTIELLSKLNIPVIENENGKIFPKSLKASDIVEGLLQEAFKNGVKVNCNETVESIEKATNFVVETDKQRYECKSLIISTGGLTYTATGSSGDGYRFARKLKITVVEPRFALAQAYSENKMTELSGVSFEVIINHFREKKIGEYQGDLLLTHQGFSGPVVLNNSRYMEKGDSLYINFVNQDKAEFEKTLLKLVAENPKKSIRQVLKLLTVNRLVDYMLNKLKIDMTLKVSEMTKKNRMEIINFLCAYKVVIDKVGKQHLAMITAGGISTEELNKKTYETKKIPGLYFVGECVDIDGDTGGYNLQFAFSSGIAAARNIRRNFESN